MRRNEPVYIFAVLPSSYSSQHLALCSLALPVAIQVTYLFSSNSEAVAPIPLFKPISSPSTISLLFSCSFETLLSPNSSFRFAFFLVSTASVESVSVSVSVSISVLSVSSAPSTVLLVRRDMRCYVSINIATAYIARDFHILSFLFFHSLRLLVTSFRLPALLLVSLFLHFSFSH